MTLRSDDVQLAVQRSRRWSPAARQQNHMAVRPSVRPSGLCRPPAHPAARPPGNICNFTGGAREGSVAMPVICRSDGRTRRYVASWCARICRPPGR